MASRLLKAIASMYLDVVALGIRLIAACKRPMFSYCPNVIMLLTARSQLTGCTFVRLLVSCIISSVLPEITKTYIW